MCSINQFSEMKEKYTNPKLKKPTTTRAKRLEKFLWQELYDEYIRYNDRLGNMVLEKSNTEYFDEFCKHTAQDDAAAKEELMHRYPLYCTRAITLWNQSGDITKDFKKRYSITRPVQEQTEQFG